jgi:type VI secretion system protein ImpH
VKSPRTLAERLEAAPHRFDPLHALRLTELGMARLGTHAAPGVEPTRIVAEQGLAFAPNPIVRVTRGPAGARVRTAFLGLTGPLGVLPQSYSELVQRADRLRNRALAAFLDMFNHRLTSLFLRAAEKYRLALLVQRSATAGSAVSEPGATPAGIGGDPVSSAMLALAGFGTPHLRGRMAVPDEALLYYAGLFTARTRPAGALQAMLSDYLEIPVMIEQFSGRWMPVAVGEQTRMPAAGEPARFATLDRDAVAGARVWDAQSAFRVVIGPVDHGQMLDLMPDQPLLRRVVDLVRVYAGVDLAFDVQVILHRDCVPDLCMDVTDKAASPRLGWNTWAKSLPALEDRRDIILDPDVVMRPPAPAPLLQTTGPSEEPI